MKIKLFSLNSTSNELSELTTSSRAQQITDSSRFAVQHHACNLHMPFSLACFNNILKLFLDSVSSSEEKNLSMTVVIVSLSAGFVCFQNCENMTCKLVWHLKKLSPATTCVSIFFIQFLKDRRWLGGLRANKVIQDLFVECFSATTQAFVKLNRSNHTSITLREESNMLQMFHLSSFDF